MDREEQSENVQLAQCGEVNPHQERGVVVVSESEPRPSPCDTGAAVGEGELSLPTAHACLPQVTIWLASLGPCRGDAVVGAALSSRTAS